MLISVDVAIFPYNCSDQTNNVRRPESIPGKSQAPHLNTFDHKSTEFMITFLELFPHSSSIICRELNICSYNNIISASGKKIRAG